MVLFDVSGARLMMRHGDRMLKYRMWGGILVLMLEVGGVCPAQYQVFDWLNFEDGKFPSALTFGHQANQETISVVDFTSPGMPPGILEGQARSECGRYGLRFQSAAQNRYLSVVSTLALDRKKLGAGGKALFQADVYLTSEAAKGSNVAVLAAAPASTYGTTPWKFYRFGHIGGARFFFSFIENESAPSLFKDQRYLPTEIVRPGWHRIQLIFEGQENISCAVDGKMTGFSPLKESSLGILQAGLMTSATPDISSLFYADNLSIQWTSNENTSLPDSPWTTAAPVDNLVGDPPPASKTLSADPGTSLTWQTSLDDAWQRCQAEKRPILILFYTPRARGNLTFNEHLKNDPSACQLFNQFVRVRVDVNQLAGGRLASRYAVFKCPQVIVFGLQGQEMARTTVGTDRPWSEVLQTLRQTLKTQ